eukprot:11157778-Lingulodinium_polyedra.AAC.1
MKDGDLAQLLVLAQRQRRSETRRADTGWRRGRLGASTRGGGQRLDNRAGQWGLAESRRCRR